MNSLGNDLKDIKEVTPRDHGELRTPTFKGKPIEVLYLATEVDETPSYHKSDISVINTKGLFNDNEVVLGFGKPNVFLLIPVGGGEHVRFAAKSLWRAPSTIEETKGRAQSGLFLTFSGLGEENINRIYHSAIQNEGGKNITCVNANASVLDDAGMRLGNGKYLSTEFMPIELFREITEHGLTMGDENEKVNIEIIKTTSLPLENYIGSVQWAVLSTLCRHISRKKGGGKKYEEKLEHSERIAKEKKKLRDIRRQSAMEDSPELMRDIDLSVANIPKRAVPLRIMWGPHTIWSIELQDDNDQKRVDIDHYLPETKDAYAEKQPSLFNKSKQMAFSVGRVSALNRVLQPEFSTFPGKSEKDLHGMLGFHNTGESKKYNIVATGEKILVNEIDVKNTAVDWVLTKHVLMSNYSGDVRFAGEIWKDKDGVIWVSNNSGTYTPSEDNLKKFVEYLQAIAPHITFKNVPMKDGNEN